MKQILVVGTNELARYYIKVMQTYANMKIIANPSDEVGHTDDLLAGLPILSTASAANIDHVDYIFWCEKDKQLSNCKQLLQSHPVILTRTQLQHLKPFVESFIQQFQHLELILNSIRDGLIVVDRDARVHFMNETAKNILQLPADTYDNQPIENLIPNSRLPKVLQHQEKEVNQRLVLNNKQQIITTRIPLINEKNHLIGAFAIFKDSNEVWRLAEENTDLKEIKMMLEAIIYASDESISVVDEHGNGLMVNPAYTRITGLSEEEVIGKPATVDIYEGESLHMQVLQTRRPVRGAKLKVGPQRKEVLVNASPIIVRGKLKGSVAVIHDTSEVKQLTTALDQAKQMIRDLETTYTFQDIVGNSPEIKIAVEQAKIGTRTSSTVLLRGESGIGKELFAHAIHNESARKYAKFIRVNCALYNESELEKELFGYEEGVFSGTEAGGKKGLFETANKGSIFLDEIGELSLTMQMKLLRILQNKELFRIGSTDPVPLDIRIITATHLNLEKAITEQSFREDLYYWLNRLPIYIPPLRDRISDLPALVGHIIQKMNQLYGRNVKRVSEKALEKLKNYSWPGNIRELEVVISKAIISMNRTDRVIDEPHLPDFAGTKSMENTVAFDKEMTLQQATDAFEKAFILNVYQSNQYNKTKTAEALGISVRNLYYKLDKYEA